MRRNRRLSAMAGTVLTAGLLTLGCSEINKQAAPVALIVTNTQDIQTLDLAGTSGVNSCDRNIGTILMEARLIQASNNTKLPPDNRLNDVKVSRYRVTYVRTDGGKLVPQPLVRSISELLTAGGGSTSLNSFLVIEPGAVNQAPFAALLPQNGGRDPETGSQFVKMDLIIEVFGETLAGEAVSGTTRFPLIFCFQCGGCV